MHYRHKHGFYVGEGAYRNEMLPYGSMEKLPRLRPVMKSIFDAIEASAPPLSAAIDQWAARRMFMKTYNNRKEYAKRVMMGKVQKKKNVEDPEADKIGSDIVTKEVAGSEADDELAGESPMLSRSFHRRSRPKGSELDAEYWETFGEFLDDSVEQNGKVKSSEEQQITQELGVAAEGTRPRAEGKEGSSTGKRELPESLRRGRSGRA